jgi:four helix bundle protein
MGDYLPIEQMEVTKRFAAVSDQVWFQVMRWKPFARDTVGKQIVRAIDSVAANIVEGGHRESGADALHFFVIARASAEEALHHLERAETRNLIDCAAADEMRKEIRSALQLLANLIKYRRSRLTTRAVREERAEYAAEN